MEEPNFWSLIVGAALAATGGLGAQLIVNFKTKTDQKKALLVGLTSELKVMRKDLDTHIGGIRQTFQKEKQLPRPDALSVSTVVFDANAGALGKLGDPDLVEHLVEVYSTIHHLRDEANWFKAFPNSSLDRPTIEFYHFQATSAQLSVMKLHNRLSRGKDTGPHNIHDSEKETREFMRVLSKRIDCDQSSIDFSYPLTTSGGSPSD